LEEIMTEQSEFSLLAELDLLRQRLGDLEAKQREPSLSPSRPRRAGLPRKLLVGALPVALVLALGGELYGKDAIDALFIDKDGNVKFSGKVGIGPTSPEAKLDVEGTVRLGRGIADSWFPFTDNNAYISGKETIIRSDNGGGSKEFVRINKDGATVSGGKIQLDGAQQIKFKDGDTSNNLKLQLWTGYGLGINGSTLFYASNGIHSWRDDNGTNERMALTTGANGGLTVKGTGNSSFAGNLGVGTTDPKAKLDVAGDIKAASLNGEKPPLVFEVGRKDDNRNWHYVNQDIGALCGDADGCTMKFFLRNSNNDEVRTIAEQVYIEQPDKSNNKEPGLRGWTRQLGGGESSYILQTANRYEIVPHPWDWIYVRNWSSREVGPESPPFGGYMVQFMTRPEIAATVVIYDH
jgi:hypothetical protein